MENLLEKIKAVQDHIFNEWYPNIFEDIILVIEFIVSNMNLWDLEKQNRIVELLKFIEFALTNKDNLILADILEYELKPLLLEVN